MLKAAFNAISRLHSRSAQLKRLGTVDIYSPCRLTPSNYFRFLRGPENTVIHGREFIIPTDTILGHFSQVVTFSTAPAAGNFKLTYNGNDTAFLAFNATAANVETALQALVGLSNVDVTGDFTAGFTVSFVGFSTAPLALTVTSSTLVDGAAAAVTTSVATGYVCWGSNLKRGDKIIDSDFGTMTIDEIIEMADLGGSTLGYRVRSE